MRGSTDELPDGNSHDTKTTPTTSRSTARQHPAATATKVFGSAESTTVVDLVRQVGFSLPIDALEGMKRKGDELEVMERG